MKVKIQHRFAFVVYTYLGSLIMVFVVGMTCKNAELRTSIIKFLAVVFFVSFIAATILAYVRTVTLTIEQGKLSIQYPVGERVINIDSITALKFKRRGSVYSSRGGRGGVVYRAGLIIEGCEEGRTYTVKLNDNATGKGESSLSNDEIPLFNIYRCLSDLTGIEGTFEERNQWEDGILGAIIQKSINDKRR